MRNLFQNVKYWLVRLIFGYVFVGSIYFLSGYIYNHLIGNDIVFSPIIAFPLVLMGWPIMLSFDIIHIQTLGLQPHSILTFLTVVVILLLFAWLGVNQMREGKRSRTE